MDTASLSSVDVLVRDDQGHKVVLACSETGLTQISGSGINLTWDQRQEIYAALNSRITTGNVGAYQWRVYTKNTSPIC